MLHVRSSMTCCGRITGAIPRAGRIFRGPRLPPTPAPRAIPREGIFRGVSGDRREPHSPRPALGAGSHILRGRAPSRPRPGRFCTVRTFLSPAPLTPTPRFRAVRTFRGPQGSGCRLEDRTDGAESKPILCRCFGARRYHEIGFVSKTAGMLFGNRFFAKVCSRNPIRVEVFAKNVDTKTISSAKPQVRFSEINSVRMFPS